MEDTLCSIVRSDVCNGSERGKKARWKKGRHQCDGKSAMEIIIFEFLMFRRVPWSARDSLCFYRPRSLVAPANCSEWKIKKQEREQMKSKSNRCSSSIWLRFSSSTDYSNFSATIVSRISAFVLFTSSAFVALCRFAFNEVECRSLGKFPRSRSDGREKFAW